MNRRMCMMLSAVAALAAVRSVMAAPADTQPAGPLRVDLAALSTAVQAEMAAWLRDDQSEKPPVHSAVQSIYPTAANIAAVGARLGEPLSDLAFTSPRPEWLAGPAFHERFETLGVRYNLLLPLKRAAAKDIQGQLNALTLLDKAANYLDLPDFAGKSSVALPAGDDPAGPREITRSEAFRRTVRYNTLIRYIRANILLLRLLADDRQADQAVLDAIQQDLDQGNITYADGLSAIESAVTEMSQEQALFFYAALREAVGKLGDRNADMLDRMTLGTGVRTNQFAAESRKPGADVAAVVNVLATRARQPAIVVPGVGARSGADRPRPRGR